MTRYSQLNSLIALAIIIVCGSALAEEDRASLVRAKRIMRKLDKDGNGTFEKKENAAAWRRYRKLDTNHDQILTIEELRKERPAYLETGGERKLNIAYKETPKGKLLLDLYYRHGERQKGKLPIPGYCLHPRWRLGSGQ